MNAAGWPPARQPHIVRLDSVGSTSDEALAIAQAGGESGIWVVAREQTGGRGRRGRVWSSPPGNLYASLLLIDPCSPEAGPQLGFVAGVALVEAISKATGKLEGIGIKWPNDILFDGAKLAGILVDASRLPDGRFACVVGIGVNCLSHPDNLPYKATNLSEAFGAKVEPDALIEPLAASLAGALDHWERGQNFERIRETWLRDCAGLGGPIEISLHGRTVAGRFETIDGAGRLIVATDKGREAIDAGDIRFTARVATQAT